MTQRYKPLRLPPETAGQLQYNYDQKVAALAATQKLFDALAHQVKAQLGAEVYWRLLDAARQQTLTAELEQECVA